MNCKNESFIRKISLKRLCKLSVLDVVVNTLPWSAIVLFIQTDVKVELFIQPTALACLVRQQLPWIVWETQELFRLPWPVELELWLTAHSTFPGSQHLVESTQVCSAKLKQGNKDLQSRCSYYSLNKEWQKIVCFIKNKVTTKFLWIATSSKAI